MLDNKVSLDCNDYIIQYEMQIICYHKCIIFCKKRVNKCLLEYCVQYSRKILWYYLELEDCQWIRFSNKTHSGLSS